MVAPVAHDLDSGLGRLTALATGLAAAWSTTARTMVTAGQERALLRLLGVGGVDAEGRPLAWEVVDRYLAGGPGRLGAGILLPFVVALQEYDASPQAVALDVAAGNIDLAMEARLLGSPQRRADAEAEARRLVAAGLARLDANRVARRELQAVLGRPNRPLVGITLARDLASDAVEEAAAAVRDGADLIRVVVPSGRELMVRLGAAGVAVVPWRPSGDRPLESDPMDHAPAGSQRGLTAIRAAVDQAAAERPAYARVAITPQALSAPEAAVVAGMERLDYVALDPIGEIVSVGVDPERSLADHAFARRLLARAGAGVFVDAGPLVVAPDLARGQPSDPAIRAGRALALQLLSVALSTVDGIPARQVVVGAIPDWLLGEDQPYARAAAEVCLRRTLLPNHHLVFVEPDTTDRRGSWPFLVGALFPAPPGGGAVVRHHARDGVRRIVSETRDAMAVASELAGSLDPGRLQGTSLVHARAAIEAGIETLERLRDGGWATVVGDQPDGSPGAGWLGRGPDSVTARTDGFDPLGDGLEPGAQAALND